MKKAKTKYSKICEKMLNIIQNEKYTFNLYFPNQISRNPKL